MTKTIKHEKILRNLAECPECHDVIESVHRHDYRHCSCGNIAVDGGKEYRRRSWRKEMPIERSEVVEEEIVVPDYSIDVPFDYFRDDMLKKCEEEPKPVPVPKKRSPLPKKSTVTRRPTRRKTVKTPA
jgi:hypothetical protein